MMMYVTSVMWPDGKMINLPTEGTLAQAEKRWEELHNAAYAVINAVYDDGTSQEVKVYQRTPRACVSITNVDGLLDDFVARCPSCGAMITNRLAKYCWACGQAITIKGGDPERA